MQFIRFSTGGYCLHKIPVGASRYSAWFDASGTLQDAERKGRLRGYPVAYPVRRGSPAWNKLQRVGRTYAQQTATA